MLKNKNSIKNIDEYLVNNQMMVESVGENLYLENYDENGNIINEDLIVMEEDSQLDKSRKK